MKTAIETHGVCSECGEVGCMDCDDPRCREPLMSDGIHEDCVRARELRIAYEHYTCPEEQS